MMSLRITSKLQTLTSVARVQLSQSTAMSVRTGSSVLQQTTDTPYVVGHDKNNKMFYIRLLTDNKKSEEKAVLEYDWIRKGYLDLYHTEVPPVFRGKGIAKLLAKAALDFAVEEDTKVKLTCTYLQKYVQDNPLPQYTERVLPDDQ